MKKIIFLVILYVSIFGHSYAQKKSREFNTDPAVFIKEFSTYIENSNRSDLLEFMKAFNKKWKNEEITTNEKSDIINMINIMRKRKMNIPYQYDYLLALKSFRNSTLDFEQYEDWHNMAVRILETAKRGKHTEFKNFIKNTGSLFESRAIYVSKARSWIIEEVEIQFKYDKDSIPFIHIPNTKLTGFTNKDSIRIYNTTGDYYPLTFEWKGRGGQLNWEKVFIDPTEVYCELPEYDINVQKSEFKVDSVQLHYTTIFNKPLYGSLHDKLKSNVKAEKNTYPRFISYEKSLEISSITKGVKYVGGFSLIGPKIIGSGDLDNPARLYFYKQDSLFIFAKSKNFSIKMGEKVVSDRAQVSVYIRLDSSQHKDSIFHAGAKLRLNIDSNEVQIMRGEHGIQRTALHNTYHQYDMYVEQINWKLGSDNIDFSMLSESAGPAIYESFDYYKDNRFTQWKSTLDYNPLSNIKRFCEREAFMDSIAAIDIARSLNPNLKVEHIRRLLYKLTEEGFLIYDQENEYVHVREKTFKYVAAHAANFNVRFADKVDFDAIRLISNNGKSANSKMNLISNNMKLAGVRKVYLSDSQNVVIHPERGSEITLKSRRDFEFLGKIEAGYLELFGSGFYFTYDNFLINMAKVDSFRLLLPNPNYDPRMARNPHANPLQKMKLRPIETTVNNMVAILRIDDPLNKSGLRKQQFSTYPELESLDYSYAYYDKKTIHDGVYKRDKPFYFRLDTFVLDSINNLQPEGITFGGTIVSANIFPDFQEILRFRDHDWSLGFVHETPDTGYPTYNRMGAGKGTFYDTIDLSNQGLRAKGMIEYIASESYSKNVIFYPDSAYANTDSFVVHKGDYNGASFPKVEADSVLTFWKPYKDTMYIQTRGEPFIMYDGEAEFRGKLMVTPWGLYGDGKMKIMEATMTSKSFRLNADDFGSKNMVLEMRSRDPKYLALAAINLKGNIDMLNRTAEYNSNDKEAYHQMPYTQYTTNMDNIKWGMDEHEVQLASTKDVKKSWYRSVHKKQDSLDFNATGGYWYLDSARNTLLCNGIPYLPIADARIFVDSGEVLIYPKAKMDTLRNAVLKADTDSFYHEIYQSVLNVQSKYKYRGQGIYDYINKTKKPQQIFFDKIRTEQYIDEDWLKDDNKWETHATGNISEEQEFELNPKIGFKGKSHVYAIDEFLTFEGYAKVYETHELVETDWFSFSSMIDPNNMSIEIKNPRNERERPLHTGYHLKGTGYKTPYYTFLNTKVNEGHHSVFTTEGILQMNEKISEVTIGKRSKLVDGSLVGQKLVFNDSTGFVYSEGKFDLGCNYGMFNYETAGNLQHNVDEGKMDFDLIFNFDFMFPKEALEIMMNDIRENTHEMPNIFYDRPQFALAMAEFMGEKETQKILKGIEETGVWKIPSAIEKTMLFTEVFMKFDSVEYTYKTTRPIGIAFIGKEPINKRVLAFMEMGYKRSGDYFNLFIQAGDQFYFFNYKNSNKTLAVVSSNNTFNRIITEIPPKKRRKKGEGKQFYMFNISSKRKAEAFRDKMLMEDESDF